MTHTITIRPATDERPGWTEVNLTMDEETVASNCGILALEMHIGAAVVRMDGIGGVGTVEAYRNHGYARHVLDAAISHMAAGDAALTMLYGITDFYPKFGYATAGPDYLFELLVPQKPTTYLEGWQARAFESDDFEAVRQLYDRSIVGTSGTAVRDPDTYPWTRLRAIPIAESGTECRVIVDEHGVVRGYAWRGTGCGFVSNYAEHAPDKLILAEVIASDPKAADVLLDACANWAFDEAVRRAQPITQVAIVMPPEGHVASAAMTRSATFKQTYIATGGSMVRVLDVARLCRALLPEFRERIKAARLVWTGNLQIVTEIGSAILAIESDDIHVLDEAPTSSQTHVIQIAQPALARLAMGAIPPYDVLGRLDDPPSATIQELVATLFPQRHPHMSLIDRY